LIAVKVTETESTQRVPMLPLPVVLFVSDAVALVKSGKTLDELPDSLPDVYANYLRRINPKLPGVENRMADDLMLRAAKSLARLALGSDYIPKEFGSEPAREWLTNEVSVIPEGIDPLRRLEDNGVLLSKTIGATTFLQFALDPVAEYLAAEAHFDRCSGQDACLERLLSASSRAPGFNNALLQTVKARKMVDLEKQN
jgi:hypothetical protein